MTLSQTAMVLAAGLGTRMRPLTDSVPKPLIKLGGIALIDHVVARLQEGGADQVIVNVHYRADQIENHFQNKSTPKIIISDERAQILDSGGGAKKMLGSISGDAFLLANSDTVWHEDRASNMQDLCRYYDPSCMDILLLLASRSNSIGFDGKGDFNLSANGQLSRRGIAPDAPYAYAGIGIFKTSLFEQTPDTPFSLNLLFDRAIEKGRLYGMPLQGTWMHVGTIDALNQAEQMLRDASS